MSAPQRRWRGSLAARIALVFLVLLLAVQLASFAALRLSWTSHRRNELPKRLETGTTLLNTLLERRVKAAVDIAEVTAADAGFRTTLFESDEIQIGSFEANPGLDSFSLIVIAPGLSWSQRC